MRPVLFGRASEELEILNPRRETLLLSGEPPVIDHQSAVLHDFDAGFGEDLRRGIVTNA